MPFVAFLCAFLVVAYFVGVVTHTLSFGHSGGSVTLSDTVTLATGTVAVDVGIALSASTTNQLVAMGYITANIKAVYIKTDVDVTIKVDSSGSPEQTILMKAGVPYIWCTGNPSVLLLATDCNVGWYLTCTLAANVYVRILN